MLAITLIVFQIVVSIAFAVSFTTLFENRSNEDQETMFRRPFEINFVTPIRDINILSKIKGDIEGDIYNASVFFEANIENRKVLLEALMYPQDDPTVEGDKITQKDNTDRAKKLIATMDAYKYEGLKCNNVGDKVLINNIQFAVIGIRSNDYEIPLETGVNNFKIVNIKVKLKNGTNIQGFLDYGEYLKDTFHKGNNTSIEIPPTPLQRTGAKLSLHIILGMIMLITALISFISVFSHIINKCKHDYIILNICGASKGFTLLLMLGQLILQFTFSYLIAISLIPLFGVFNSKGSPFSFNLKIEIILVVFFFSALAILIISLPYILKMVKNSIVLNRQNNI